MSTVLGLLNDRQGIVIGSVLAFLCLAYSGLAGEFVEEEGRILFSSEGVDQEVSVSQIRLLDLAFDTATAIPVDPHGKDRSRAQAAVVTACLKLGQPKRALSYIEQIEDWRQGEGYADLAFYCVQAGITRAVTPVLEYAEALAEKTEDWRRDRIRVRIAQTYVLLGNANLAKQFETGVVDSEAGKVAGIRAAMTGEGSFEEQFEELNALVQQGNFDILNNTLRAYVQLFHQFFEDVDKRTRIKDKIISSWDSLPIFIRIELLMELAGFAIQHNEEDQALALIDDAQQMLGKYQWPLEEQIRMMAKLAEFRFRAGDKPTARKQVDAALTLFDERGKSIVNIWRAGALRPLAETFEAMGDRDAARSVYRMAIEEGVENPNSRPRAEDLSATCCSMALVAFEPDEELWERILAIREGLGQPW